jgi:hypothetical protein
MFRQQLCFLEGENVMPLRAIVNRKLLDDL